jgi:hypothetical protein
MKQAVTLKADLPVFVVIGIMHLSDILFTVTGGYKDILWLVLLISLIHFALLGLIWFAGRKAPAPNKEFLFAP